jgi:hypothetical protein
MSLDKRQMFSLPHFCMHFCNNDFTILLSQSILTADNGEDCGTTVDIQKEREATNAFSIHRHTFFCSYHSPTAPTPRECLAITIPPQLPHSESALQLPFTHSSHTQRGFCIYHFPTAPTLRECLAVTVPLQLPHSERVLQLPFPHSFHTQKVSCSYYSPTAPILRECLAVTIHIQCSQSGLLLRLTFPFIIHRHSDSLLYLTVSFSTRYQTPVSIKRSPF